MLLTGCLSLFMAILSSCGTVDETPADNSMLQRDEQQLLGPGGSIDRGQQAPNTP
jgi:hypothetical protein